VDKDATVVRSGNIITSQAMGTSHDFGLEIVKYFAGEEAASSLKSNIRF
jgi:4-methyl-5(b-hydroxyethyl)-thiazole monophosphate biosynthesis